MTEIKDQLVDIEPQLFTLNEVPTFAKMNVLTHGLKKMGVVGTIMDKYYTIDENEGETYIKGGSITIDNYRVTEDGAGLQDILTLNHYTGLVTLNMGNLNMNSNSIEEVYSLDNNGSSIRFDDTINMNHNNILNITSITGGDYTRVAFEDDIYMNGSNIDVNGNSIQNAAYIDNGSGDVDPVTFYDNIDMDGNDILNIGSESLQFEIINQETESRKIVASSFNSNGEVVTDGLGSNAVTSDKFDETDYYDLDWTQLNILKDDINVSNLGQADSDLDMNQNQTINFVLDRRAADSTNPDPPTESEAVVGQMWIRTDL